MKQLSLLLLALIAIGCAGDPWKGDITQAMRDSSVTPDQRRENVRRLLDRGHDPNERIGPFSDSVLNEAIHREDLALVQMLLEHGAQPNASRETDTFYSPMLTAARSGNTGLVRLLVKHGGDPNRLQPNVFAVSYAANLETAKLLLPKPEVMARRFPQGGSVLVQPASGGKIEIVRLLLENGALKDEPDGPSHLLGLAGTDLLKLLVEHGAKPNAAISNVDRIGRYRTFPVIAQAANRRYDELLYLLNLGANANSKDARGFSALHHAAKNGDTEIARILMKHGAQPEIRDSLGRTPLHLAALGNRGLNQYDKKPVIGPRGSLPMADLLLSKGAFVDAEDENGETPLFRAVSMNDRLLVQALLKAGANPKHRNKAGESIADRVKDLDRKEILADLEARR